MQIFAHFGIYDLATSFITLQYIQMTEKYPLIACMLIKYLLKQEHKAFNLGGTLMPSWT